MSKLNKILVVIFLISMGLVGMELYLLKKAGRKNLIHLKNGEELADSYVKEEKEIGWYGAGVAEGKKEFQYKKVAISGIITSRLREVEGGCY